MTDYSYNYDSSEIELFAAINDQQIPSVLNGFFTLHQTNALTMPTLQHAIDTHTDGVLSVGSVFESLPEDEVPQQDIADALHVLERIDVLATDSHIRYLTNNGSPIYSSTRNVTRDFDGTPKALDFTTLDAAHYLLFDFFSNKLHRPESLDELSEELSVPEDMIESAFTDLLDWGYLTENNDGQYQFTDEHYCDCMYNASDRLGTYGRALPQTGMVNNDNVHYHTYPKDH